jgi:hypothetical protein
MAVISDIDDTIIQTGATRLWQAARSVLLGTAHTRLPFPGVAPFYRALESGPDGQAALPFFYVSSSPWNLYDVLLEVRVAAIRALAEKVLASGSTLVLAEDTVAAARHAAAQGWIDPGRLPDIVAGKEADEPPAPGEKTPAVVVEAPGAPPPPGGPGTGGAGSGLL